MDTTNWLTSAQVKARAKISRERLRQLRAGYVNRRGYSIPARLAQGVDWEWRNGIIIYSPRAVRLICSKKRQNSRKKGNAKKDGK